MVLHPHPQKKLRLKKGKKGKSKLKSFFYVPITKFFNHESPLFILNLNC